MVSTAMPMPLSSLLPPRYVEYTSPDPVASSFVTKASIEALAVCTAPGVVGKLVESVRPVT